jgi:O-antigen/teichoic acid export membrane protein
VLSFRISELVVRYGGAYLEQGQQQKAAALIKASGLAEMGVSILAFLAVLTTAGIGARYVAKTPGSEWMFVLYALGLLANFNTETSTGVLQITNKIRARGTINLIQSVVSVLMVAVVFVLDVGQRIEASSAILLVLTAYLVGKAILGIGLFLTAQAALRPALGPGWRGASYALLPPFRELFGFAFSSNLSATAILIFRESELLWVGLFLNSEAAGLYKIAYTIVSLLSVPADPLILSVYPEANRLIVQRSWQRLRQFLRQVTTVSFSYNLLLAMGLILLGRWVLGIFGDQYRVAYPALMVLLAGLAFNYTLFWNRPLLLSLGLQAFALYAILAVGVLKIALAIPLVPKYGYVMEAVLLSSYYVISVGFMVWRGLRELSRLEAPIQASADRR